MLRATFAGFSVARGALTASQKALDVTGQNISNVYTEGYTRQRLDQVSLSSGYGNYSYSNYNTQVGNGVLITGISQIRDPYLDIQYRNQMANVGAADAKNSILEQVESVFDETMKSAVKDAFSDLESKLLDLANSTGSELDDSLVRASLESLVSLFHFNATSLADKRQQITDDFTTNSIRQLNSMMEDIAELNRSIKNGQVLGYPSLELQDQRNKLIDELASYLPIEKIDTDEWLSSQEKVTKVSINLLITQEEPVMKEVTKYQRDNNGDLILDPNGDPIPVPALDENGNPKVDSNGDPVYETELVAVTQEVPVYEKDANGNIVYDDQGNPKQIPVYEQAVDPAGNPVVDANGNPVWVQETDSSGNPLTDADGNPVWRQKKDDDGNLLWKTEEVPVTRQAIHRITLVDNEKFGSLSYETKDDNYTEVTINHLQYDNDGQVLLNPDGTLQLGKLTLKIGGASTQQASSRAADNDSEINGGTVKATLEMLNSSGVFDGDATNEKGLGYYEKAFDLLVHTFATEMNKLNEKDPSGQGDGGPLFVTNDGSDKFTAANIKVNEDWIRGDVKLKAKQNPQDGTTQNDNINKFIELLNSSTTEFKVNDSDTSAIYEGNFYNYYVNMVESTLGIEQQATKNLLDNHITVINTISQSRDQVSGVSLDEEGVNLMQYQQSYTAASRLMTTLDEILDKLINSTGVCGR